MIDFNTIAGDNNIYEVVTEFTCKNGSEEFRPDITVLVNGMPLVFIEVKKPSRRHEEAAISGEIIMQGFFTRTIDCGFCGFR